MADIAESVGQLLAGSAAITALIGDRIYPDEIPQNADLPAVAFWKINTNHVEAIKGLAGAAETRIEFEIHATTRTSASAIARAIKNVIFPGGDSIRGTFTGTKILEATLDQGERNYALPPSDGSDDHRYVTAQDYVFSHLEN